MSGVTDTTWLELVPDAVVIVDDSGRIVFANRNCDALLGWPATALLGEPVERLVPARVRDHRNLRERFAADPSRRPMGAGLELSAVHRSGAEIAVDIALNPVELDGRPHVVVSLRDVRIQRESAEKLNQLSIAVDAAASGVVVTDLQGRIVRVNPAACAMTGYAEHELLGRTPSILKSGVHDAAMYERLWAAVRAGETWQGRLVNRRKDGSLYHEEQTIAPVKDRTGQVTHFIAIKQDVTARVEAERQLQDARDELANRVREVERLSDQLREEAIRCPLSGLFNRRYLDETLPRELARAAREGTPLVLAMLDIDRFKAVNDTHGHSVGDRVIAALGQLLRQATRASDIACRFGGEEFVVILPVSDLDHGERRAEDWRRSFSGVTVPVGPAAASTTLSVGVAQWQPGETAASLLSRADGALYRAKREGRDRIATAS